MAVREKLKNEAYFSAIIDKKTESIAEFEAILSSRKDADFPSRMRWAFRINMDYQERLCAMFSRGDAISSMEEPYIEFLDNFGELITVAIDNIDYVRDQYAYSLDKFYRIAAWAVLFKVDTEDRKDFVERLDFFGQQKPCDMLFKRAGLLDREINERVGAPQVYGPLLEALENPDADQQIALIERFLKGWYAGLKKIHVAWIDNHKSQFDIYFGYWCFEAAAAVKVLGLDPDRFAKLPYFPRDMI